MLHTLKIVHKGRILMVDVDDSGGGASLCGEWWFDGDYSAAELTDQEREHIECEAEAILAERRTDAADYAYEAWRDRRAER